MGTTQKNIIMNKPQAKKYNKNFNNKFTNNRFTIKNKTIKNSKSNEK